MKSLVKMLMFLACMGLLASCEKDSDYSPKPVFPAPDGNFLADFVVLDASENPNATGGSKTWTGHGHSPLLGPFSVEINLVCDIDNLCFAELHGKFLIQDGSALFFQITEGRYSDQNSCEIFQLSFHETAQITGGTGLFADATGEFKTNANIHNGGIPAWENGELPPWGNGGHQVWYYWFNGETAWFARFSCSGNVAFGVD